MNKDKPRVQSARTKTANTAATVSKTSMTLQKCTKRRVRSISSPAVTSESQTSNCAAISRTSSSANISQLSDSNTKSTQNSPSHTNRTSGTNNPVRTTPNSEVTTGELDDVVIQERRTDKTFIYMYDEKEKTSKEVVVPKDLHVTLPVLVQYEITKETIRQVTDAAGQSGTARTELEPHSEDSEMVYPETRYVTPTPALLCNNEEDEMKNKGARIMQWLLEVQCE